MSKTDTPKQASGTQHINAAYMHSKAHSRPPERISHRGWVFLGSFVGFFAGIQVTTGLYAVELCKAGDCGFRPSAEISQQTFLGLFVGRENVREKRDSERLIQCFSRLRETGNRVYFSYLHSEYSML
jgi:hypothetical protein